MPSYGLRNQRALFRKNLLCGFTICINTFKYYKAYFIFPFWNIRIVDQPVVFSVHLNSDPMTSPSESSFPFPLPFFQNYTQLFIESYRSYIKEFWLVGEGGPMAFLYLFLAKVCTTTTMTRQKPRALHDLNIVVFDLIGLRKKIEVWPT